MNHSSLMKSRLYVWRLFPKEITCYLGLVDKEKVPFMYRLWDQGSRKEEPQYHKFLSITEGKEVYFSVGNIKMSWFKKL